MLVPISDADVHYPLAVYVHDGTNDTFNGEIIQSHWDIIEMVGISNGITIEGHSSDGDIRTRNVVYNRHRLPKNSDIWIDFD